MNLKIKIVIITLFIPCGSISAQIVTDRPDQTESSVTVPKGALQIESGVLLEYSGNDQPSTRQLLLPTNLFRYGIFKGVEIRISNQYELNKTADSHNHGISDMEIGTKIQLLKRENVNTEIAFLTHLIVPTGTKEVSGNGFGTSNKLSVSHEINETVGIGYNIGYNYLGEGRGDFVYSLSLGIGINEKVGMYIEPFGELTNFEEFISDFDAGFTYLANNNLQFDFSFGTGINQRMNYISLGFSWLLEKNK